MPATGASVPLHRRSPTAPARSRSAPTSLPDVTGPLGALEAAERRCRCVDRGGQLSPRRRPRRCRCRRSRPARRPGGAGRGPAERLVVGLEAIAEALDERGEGVDREAGLGEPGHWVPSGSGSGVRCSTASCQSPTAWLAMMSATGIEASSARAAADLGLDLSGRVLARVGSAAEPRRSRHRRRRPARRAGRRPRGGAHLRVSRGCSRWYPLQDEQRKWDAFPTRPLHGPTPGRPRPRAVRPGPCSYRSAPDAPDGGPAVTRYGGRVPCPPSSRPERRRRRRPIRRHASRSHVDEAGDQIATHEVRINDRIRAREVFLVGRRRRAARGQAPPGSARAWPVTRSSTSSRSRPTPTRRCAGSWTTAGTSTSRNSGAGSRSARPRTSSSRR